MNRLQEIEERLSAIQRDLDKEDSNLDELEQEIETLKEERKTIKDKAEKRKKLIDDVVNTRDAKVIQEFKEPEGEKMEQEKRFTAESQEYRSAFFKKLRKEELTEVEERAYTHTTTNTDAVLPTDTMNQIFTNMKEKHPILNDVQILNSGTVISIVKHTAIVAGDAAQVAEGVANTDEQNTFVEVSLSGKDFSKHVELSYGLARMAMPAFEQYISTEIADRLGSVMADDVITTIKAGLAVANSVGTATLGTLAESDYRSARSLLKNVTKPIVYANESTIFNHIAGMETQNVSFAPSMNDDIPGRVYGSAIKPEDAMLDDELLIIDPRQFVYNMVQGIMIERDKDIKRHVDIIAGYARAEGTLTNDKAGTLLTIGQPI